MLPRGYRILWEFSGSYLGMVGAGSEVTWVYNRSCDDPDAAYPVVVMRLDVAPGSRDRSQSVHGRVVDVDSSTSAVYQRGWADPGLKSVTDGVVCATAACRRDN